MLEKREEGVTGVGRGTHLDVWEVAGRDFQQLVVFPVDFQAGILVTKGKLMLTQESNRLGEGWEYQGEGWGSLVSSVVQQVNAEGKVKHGHKCRAALL